MPGARDVLRQGRDPLLNPSKEDLSSFRQEPLDKRDTIYEDIRAYREALLGGRVFSSFSSALCSVFMADKEKLQGDSIF